MALALWALPAMAADLQSSGTVLTGPDEPADQPPPGRLILPGQPGRAGLPSDTLPPLWLVPLPDKATRAAERAQLDVALAARFAPAAPLQPQGIDQDVAPVAGGQSWQMLQRRIDDTLGP